MSKEALIYGLEFAKKFNLTHKEIEVLIPFLSKPRTTVEVAALLVANKITLHHSIQRLKLKKLLVLKDRDEKGTYLYQFDDSQIEE